ncbi:MAG: hypothetical protein Q9193_006988, partial [Seirophora villosa]
AGLCQILGRLLYYSVPPSNRISRTLLSPSRLIIPFFIILDVVALFNQLVGLSIIVQNIKKDDEPARREGADILGIGLVLQAPSPSSRPAIFSISKRWQFYLAGQRQVEAGRGDRELSDY